jgi:hypothetical protein
MHSKIAFFWNRFTIAQNVNKKKLMVLNSLMTQLQTTGMTKIMNWLLALSQDSALMELLKTHAHGKDISSSTAEAQPLELDCVLLQTACLITVTIKKQTLPRALQMNMMITSSDLISTSQ